MTFPACLNNFKSGAEETVLVSRNCLILHIAHLSLNNNLDVIKDRRTLQGPSRMTSVVVI